MKLLSITGLFAVVILLTGCSRNPEWMTAPEERVCSVDQMGRVQAEAKWCSDNTQYLTTFCYGSAISRICDTRGEAK